MQTAHFGSAGVVTLLALIPSMVLIREERPTAYPYLLRKPIILLIIAITFTDQHLGPGDSVNLSNNKEYHVRTLNGVNRNYAVLRLAIEWSL